MECEIGYNTYKIRQRGVDMEDNFTGFGFERIFHIEEIITLFYMELSKNFFYDGESHDFW